MTHKHEWETLRGSTRCVECGQKKANAIPKLRGTRGTDKVKRKARAA